MNTPDRNLEADFRALESLLGVTLTVHDLTGIFRDAADAPLLSPQMTSHQHPACRTGRNERRCIDDCQKGANERARRTGRPFVHVCWKRVAETVVPIIRENVHVATIFAGAFRKKTSRNRAARRTHALPVLDARRARELGSVLTVFGQGVILRVEGMRRPPGEEGGRENRIRRFLMYRAHRNVRLADLAAELHLSPSRTSHVVRELCGMSFRTLLLRERLSRARTLLLTRDYPVGEVARRAGFEDQYHFNRAFKKAYRLPPGRFRRRRRVGS